MRNGRTDEASIRQLFNNLSDGHSCPSYRKKGRAKVPALLTQIAGYLRAKPVFAGWASC